MSLGTIKEWSDALHPVVRERMDSYCESEYVTAIKTACIKSGGEVPNDAWKRAFDECRRIQWAYLIHVTRTIPWWKDDRANG